MPFLKKLKEIDDLQTVIAGYGKLGGDILNKINYKFRLDWNYYSNKMEGNTLTREETKSVMANNIDVNGKPYKDIAEMSGHDKTIQSVLQMSKGELNVSESRIRDIHKSIMYEEDESKKQQIGKWKTESNHIINYRDEKFEFSHPLDVKNEVHELTDWIQAEKAKINTRSKDARHPVELAFEFHLRYLTIHPFYDGNGRTGRILMNIILISFGYPPVYIKDTEREIYYRILSDVQGYGADKEQFFDVMADYLIRSLRIVLAAVEGKEIEEPDDLDKKLELLEVELNAIDPENEVKLRYSKDTLLAAYEGWITKLITIAVPVVQKFNKLFTGTHHSIAISSSGVHVNFVGQPVQEIITVLTKSINDNLERLNHYPQEMWIQSFYGTFKKGGLNAFGCNYGISIKFDNIKYEVFVNEFIEDAGLPKQVKLHERLLHQRLTEEEMKQAARLLGDAIFKHIDYNTKKIGLRK